MGSPSAVLKISFHQNLLAYIRNAIFLVFFSTNQPHNVPIPSLTIAIIYAIIKH
jgi:hypothetical protein